MAGKKVALLLLYSILIFSSPQKLTLSNLTLKSVKKQKLKQNIKLEANGGFFGLCLVILLEKMEDFLGGLCSLYYKIYTVGKNEGFGGPCTALHTVGKI